MYASLDRADVSATTPTGEELFVQTDARSTAEMADRLPLSVAFALIRVLNPRRLVAEGEPAPIIVYLSPERPPEAMRRAIAAAGGRLRSEPLGDDIPYPGGAPELRPIVETAFPDLADAVMLRRGARLGMESLAQMEAEILEEPPSREGDEIAFWTTVLELGSVAGEVIRDRCGGRWSVVTGPGTLPIALLTASGPDDAAGDGAKVNPFGKAIKLLADGEDESVLSLVQAVCAIARRGVDPLRGRS